MSGEVRYSAFISYSHRDSTFALRLHRALEAYRIPPKIARNRNTGEGDPRRLGFIFRDRDELTAASDLSAAVRSAIDRSESLIVVCSPAAKASDWVNREVQVFREVHGSDRIFAALIVGEPSESFPPTLIHVEGTAASFQPLAADFRRKGDGKKLALLKLVAAISDVPLDGLVHRDAQRRLRQLAGLSAVAATILIATGLLTLSTLSARETARRERERGRGVVDYMLTDLRARVKRTGRLDVLDAVNKGVMSYDRGRPSEPTSTSGLIERAKLLQAIGEDDGKRGDYDAALVQFLKASRITSTLIRARPRDPSVIFAESQSQYWSGFAKWHTADLEGAGAAFRTYATLAHTLVSIDPKNIDWLLEWGYANSNLGAFVLRQSMDVDQAHRLFSIAQDSFKTAAMARPGDRDVRFNVSDGDAWLADTERLAGDCAGALAERTRQRQLLQEMLARDPGDFQVRAALAANGLGLARIALARGHFEVADGDLKDAHAQAEGLAKLEPADKDAARQTRIIELFQVRTWTMMSPNRRPPMQTILRTLGDCEADAARRSNEELAEYCTIVRQHVPGELHLSYLKTPRPNAPRLSEHWLLDFGAEAKAVRSLSRTTCTS